MPLRTLDEVYRARRSIERVRHVSDRLIGVGPFGVGLDGLLGWIPGFGAVYSIGAGGFLLFHGARVRAPLSVLAQVAVLIGANTLSNFVPTAGGLVDMLFTAHKWSANLLLRHMDNTLYVEGERREAERSPEYRALMEQVRAGQERRRIVFLS